jgi:hypothetical protein
MVSQTGRPEHDLSAAMTIIILAFLTLSIGIELEPIGRDRAHKD